MKGVVAAKHQTHINGMYIFHYNKIRIILSKSVFTKKTGKKSDDPYYSRK